MLCALIMAGGRGTRFWPLSTEEKPKQFLNLVGNETMLQMTVNRINKIIPKERIFICTGKKYVSLVKEQISDIDDRNIIIEPEGRSTAPCIALSALVINRYFEDADMVVLPSDHLINYEDKFIDIVESADKFINVNKDAIITLGITPTRAETGYGYIKCGEEIDAIDNNKILKVERFVEKPDELKAEMYIRQGNYLWNGGMFIWNNNSILNKIKEFLPNTYEALKNVKYVEEDKLQEEIDKNYKKTDSISIDYGILEKATDIFVVPSKIGWDDIGTWKSIERYRQSDENSNIFSENVKMIQSRQNMVVNNKEVVMIGVSNTLIVETEERIFVVDKKYMDNLKDYKNMLR